MDLGMVILSEVSQRSRNIARCLLDAESKETRSKRAYNTEMDSEKKAMAAGGKDGGRDSEGVWDGQVHAAVFEM